MNAVYCFRCGKRVSNKVSEDLVIRAFVECPECIEAAYEETIPTPSDVFWEKIKRAAAARADSIG